MNSAATPSISLITGDLADPVWTRLTAAARDATHPLRLMVVATCRPDSAPAARLMTLRGAQRDASKIWFHSDRRTPKVADLKSNAGVCAVGFDPRDGVELRLDGRAEVLETGPEADRQWLQASEVIRRLYASPHAPGEPVPAVDARLAAPREELSHALTRRARANFAVIEVTVETIDWFQIVGTQHARATLRASSGWRTEYTTPTV